jgi:HSP20 family molecular chaperone IbpA
MFLSLLDLLRQTGGASLSVPPAASLPAMGVTDQGSHLQFRAQLPGIDPKSVKVQLTETTLGVSGFGTVEEKTEGPNFCCMQAGASSFYRELPLPARIDPHRAAMQWQADGSLLITMPKQ